LAHLNYSIGFDLQPRWQFIKRLFSVLPASQLTQAFF
jgi:hypothetical protein